MSFGLSCVDLISCAKFALDAYNIAQYAVPSSPQKSLGELLCELAIIADSCERAMKSLESVGSLIRQLGLTLVRSVYFLFEHELALQEAKLSLELLEQLLMPIGQGERRGGRQNRYPLSPSNLKYNAAKLIRDLERRAKERRLVLVCQNMGGAVLKEALRRKSSTNHGRWLLDRIAGIVFLDTSQSHGNASWDFPSVHPRSSHNFKPTDPGDRRRLAPSSRVLRSGHELDALRDCVNIITIGTGEASSILMRQASHFKIMWRLLQLIIAQVNPGNCTSYSCTKHRRHSMEIRCHREDLADCRLWSILRLVEGERMAKPGIESITSHLNFKALLGRFAYAIKDALDQKSPARQEMTLKILHWTAWSMRPLESRELFAALATRIEPDTKTESYSGWNDDLCPDTEESLLSFCPDLLEIRHGHLVAFRDDHLRSLLRSPWSTSLGFASAEAAHEGLAAVCFRHLACIHEETILRPWIKIGPMLRRQIRHCHLRSYCTNHWQDHYRAAETSSRSLAAMLHGTLEAAFGAATSSTDVEIFDITSRMSTGVWICSLWDFEILGRTYLEMGADVDGCSGINEAPLHVAAANASTNMLRLLLDRGADCEVRDEYGLTPLQQACRAGALEVAALLLQNGADPESSISLPELSMPASAPSHRTPLHLAATYGHPDLVKALLEAGSDLQASTADSSSTALHFAVEHGSEDAVRYLMDFGADVEAENARSETALKIAIKERHDSIVKLLLERGARRASSSEHDKIYLGQVLGSDSIASTLQKFKSLGFEGASTSSSREEIFPFNGSRSPIMVIPASHGKFDDNVESAAESGWTFVNKMEIGP